jgi:hypothetical protein
MLGRIGLAAIVALAAASCGGPTPTPTPVASRSAGVGSLLGVANGTTVVVSIAVNGTMVATVPAGNTEIAIPAVLPARPWTVEARSPSGRLLATLTVLATDNISATSSLGAFGDLGCGHLVLWAGGPIPDHPLPSPASQVPCD